MWIEEIDLSWTLFLDRDGVINERNFEGYITDTDSFKFTPYFLESIARIREKFGRIIVVTNQQGVGKGVMTNAKLEEIHKYMHQIIAKNNGKIDHVLTATNLKNTLNDRRKPLPVMGFEAKQLFPDIEFKKSIMIGDTNSDILFGKNLGMRTILLQSKEKVTETADLEIANFNELIQKLKV